MLVRVPWGTSSRWRGSDRRGVNDAAVRLLLLLLLLLLAGPRCGSVAAGWGGGSIARFRFCARGCVSAARSNFG